MIKKNQERTMKEFAGKHILIIIENLPAPFDRRVWQEACTLNANGAHITIICPKMRCYIKSYERIDGIDIYRHPLPVEGAGPLGYLQEYNFASANPYCFNSIFFMQNLTRVKNCRDFFPGAYGK